MSLQWNPSTYLQFETERSRPFVDLLARVPTDPRTIVDIGCGPGHLTAALRSRWPAAEVVGLDASPQMIERAVTGNDDPRTHYELVDVTDWAPQERPDLITSNATFQWVPDQLAVIERVRDLVAEGGVLAFSVPVNFEAPSHVLLHEIASRGPYAAYTREVARLRALPTHTYLDTLAAPGWELDVWETTYLHILSGPDPVYRWIAGTGARPVLQALPNDLLERFVTDYKAALADAYPSEAFGTVLPFARAFVVASRVAP